MEGGDGGQSEKQRGLVLLCVRQILPQRTEDGSGGSDVGSSKLVLTQLVR